MMIQRSPLQPVRPVSQLELQLLVLWGVGDVGLTIVVIGLGATESSTVTGLQRRRNASTQSHPRPHPSCSRSHCNGLHVSLRILKLHLVEIAFVGLTLTFGVAQRSAVSSSRAERERTHAHEHAEWYVCSVCLLLFEKKFIPYTLQLAMTIGTEQAEKFVCLFFITR